MVHKEERNEYTQKERNNCRNIIHAYCGDGTTGLALYGPILHDPNYIIVDFWDHRAETSSVSEVSFCSRFPSRLANRQGTEFHVRSAKQVPRGISVLHFLSSVRRTQSHICAYCGTCNDAESRFAITKNNLFQIRSFVSRYKPNRR